MRDGTRVEGKKAGILFVAAVIAALVLIGGIIYAVSLPKPIPTLQIDQLNTAQIDRLERLCRVWGAAKYQHPVFASGQQDWDAALLKLMPDILAANDLEETDRLLLAWLEQLGPAEKQPLLDIGNLTVQILPDTSWFSDGTYSPELANALQNLFEINHQDRARGPVRMTNNSVPVFETEKQYEKMDYQNDGLRLLGLFRYWNIIEFYYPNKPIPDVDWGQTLREFIPRIIEGDELAYKQTFCALVSRLQDTHATIFDTGHILRAWIGDNMLPVKFLILDHQVVLTEIAPEYASDSALKVGDIVRAIDGEDIWKVINRKLQFISTSSKDRIVNALSYDLFRTSGESMRLTIERPDGIVELTEKCGSSWYPRDQKDQALMMLADDIALINPCALEKNQIFELMNSVINTKGIVVDLRQYPSDFLPFSLSTMLLEHPTPFVQLDIPDRFVPGRFLRTPPISVGNKTGNPDYYKGRVVLLMNECSLSQSEYTIMALRQNPNAVVVGSPSVGADGDVVKICLPGGIVTFISSLGVYYPDGTPTQRVGLMPDVWCVPTIEGIRAGRDELIEKAVEIIRAA